MNQDLLEAIATYIKSCNEQFLLLLKLKPTYYQGDACPGEKYGFTMPREFDPGKKNIRQGYQEITWQVDVLAEFIVPQNTNIQSEVMKLMLGVTSAIAKMDQVPQPHHAMAGDWRAGKLSSVQSQLVREPHHWQITVAGPAFFTQMVYRDRCGEYTIKC